MLVESKLRDDLGTWRKLREYIEERKYDSARRLVNKQVKTLTDLVVEEEAQREYDRGQEDPRVKEPPQVSYTGLTDPAPPDEEGASGVEATAVT